MNDINILMTFEVHSSCKKKFDEWKEKHAHKGQNLGAIGGKFTYCFTPTSIGTVVKVKCFCGDESDLTDYGEW